MEVARQAVETMLGCPVALADGTPEFFARFEHDQCLEPKLQPAFTAAYLRDFAAKLAEGLVVELREPLGCAVTLARLGPALAVIGPYVGQELRPGEADELLGRLHVPGSYLQMYKLYHSGHAIVESEPARRGVLALAGAAGLAAEEFGYERAAADIGPVVEPGRQEAITPAPYEVVEERYKLETHFMAAVAGGDEREALSIMAAMARLPRLPGQYLNPWVGATIMRVITRLAAQQAGLPPVVIDAISQSYAQRLYRSSHTPESFRSGQAIADMVADFCRQVRRHQRGSYSPLIRQAIDDIDLHLGGDIAPGDLARRLHVSESQLARRFKAETGQTVTRYITGQRMARAAHLLATTAQPVRDIAEFVGYADANYFVKVFKSVYATTPTQYRRAA
jgi:AraC-like DNA-binding protein